MTNETRQANTTGKKCYYFLQLKYSLILNNKHCWGCKED